MIKVTMIMPIYNAENFLQKAIDSVVNQTLKEIEIILVDDGSSDSSGDICDRYAEFDKRIVVMHQKNSGMCAARNNAIDIAKGEYLAFMDNDDIIHAGLLENAYKAAKKFSADMVKFGRKSSFVNAEDKLLHNEIRQFTEEEYFNDDIRKNYFQLEKKECLSAVWDGIYKTETVRRKKVYFHEEFRYGNEDHVFCRELFPYLESLVLIPGCYYTHYTRKSYSASAKFNEKALDKHKQSYYYEKSVWDKLGYLNNFNVDVEFAKVREYIIPLLLMLNRPISTWKIKEKKRYLKQMGEDNAFEINLTRERFFKMLKTEKAQSFIALLYYWKFYGLLLCLIKFYSTYVSKKITEM